MRRIRTVLVALLLTTAPVVVWAQGNPRVKAAMTDAGCFACHAVTYKLVGPAYGWVAYVFAKKPGAKVKLAQKIITGGAGRWNSWTGGIPMPPHPQLTLAEAEKMASWVLAQHPLAPPKP